MRRFIPIIKCKDLNESLSFYTKILDFELMPGESLDSPVIDLVKEGAQIQLSVMSGDSVFGCAVNVEVDDVDTLFQKFISRGLDVSYKKESPVHQGPIDQTWGMREFYVTDHNGNTLRFRKPLE
jgi:catechol 2,3-dioxygenase-like lactoylglutathione lyase family enzyme